MLSRQKTDGCLSRTTRKTVSRPSGQAETVSVRLPLHPVEHMFWFKKTTVPISSHLWLLRGYLAKQRG
jgi:hypothetical protein